MNLRHGLPDARLLGCCCRRLATAAPQPGRANVEGKPPQPFHYTTIVSFRCPLHGPELETAVPIALGGGR